MSERSERTDAALLERLDARITSAICAAFNHGMEGDSRRREAGDQEERLRLEVRAALADSRDRERLDWLQEHGSKVDYDVRFPGAIDVYRVWPHSADHDNKAKEGRTLREAIDAAMSASPPSSPEPDAE